jgi:hypothetical protein
MFLGRKIFKCFSRYRKKRIEDFRKILTDTLISESSFIRNKKEIKNEYLTKMKKVLKNWELKSSIDSTNLTLIKDEFEYQMKVNFNVKNIIKITNENKKIDFFLSIEKIDSKIMIFRLSYFEDKMTIKNIFFVEKGEEDLFWENFEKNEDFYFGPDFNFFSLKVKKSFYDFLNKLEIDENFCKFIEQASLFHEETLFLYWIKNLYNHLIKKEINYNV